MSVLTGKTFFSKCRTSLRSYSGPAPNWRKFSRTSKVPTRTKRASTVIEVDATDEDDEWDDVLVQESSDGPDE